MGFFRRLYSFDDNIDFKKGWRVGAILSVVLCLTSIGFLFGRGLNLGIDFRGGIAWQFPANGASVSTVTHAVDGAGASNPQVQRVGSGDMRVEVPPAKSDAAKTGYESKITAAIAKVTHQPASTVDQNLNEVGPTWGSDVSAKAIKALVIFLIAIFLYVWIRLEWKFALSAIVAVIHDVILSVGVYSVFKFEVTPGTVIAFLTILGYSLYDTIVVYDKIRENQSKVTPNGRLSYTDMTNLSVNQTFMRSINTTLSAVIPVLSILIIGAWVMGAVTLEEFGLALLVGLISGAYSSVFIAAPLTAWIKEREPRYAAIRARVARLSPAEKLSAALTEPGDDSELDEAGEPAAVGGRAGFQAASAGSSPRPRGVIPPRPGDERRSAGTIAPRPRKQTADRRKKR
jgi:preprotein translocase subunit SecF